MPGSLESRKQIPALRSSRAFWKSWMMSQNLSNTHQKAFQKLKQKETCAGNLLRPVRGPEWTGFSGDQRNIATLRVSSTVQFFQMFWRLPCFAARPFSQNTSRASSCFGFTWLSRTSWRTQTTQDLWRDLWPCQLELVGDVVKSESLQRFCSCHAHSQGSFLLISTVPSPRSTLRSQHSNTQNLQCLWIDMNDPVQNLFKQLGESTNHPGTHTQVYYTITEALLSGQTKPSCKGIFQHLALSLGLYRPGTPAEFQDSA